MFNFVTIIFPLFIKYVLNYIYNVLKYILYFYYDILISHGSKNLNE